MLVELFSMESSIEDNMSSMEVKIFSSGSSKDKNEDLGPNSKKITGSMRSTGSQGSRLTQSSKNRLLTQRTPNHGGQKRQNTIPKSQFRMSPENGQRNINAMGVTRNSKYSQSQNGRSDGRSLLKDGPPSGQSPSQSLSGGSDVPSPLTDGKPSDKNSPSQSGHFKDSAPNLQKASQSPQNSHMNFNEYENASPQSSSPGSDFEFEMNYSQGTPLGKSPTSSNFVMGSQNSQSPTGRRNGHLRIQVILRMEIHQT